MRSLNDWLVWRPAGDAATANPANFANETSATPPSVAEIAEIAVAAGYRSYLWQITEGSKTRNVMISGCPSLAEVRDWYPQASIAPGEQSTAQKSKLMWRDESHLRNWLTESGETDPAVINQLIADFRRWGRNGS
jgi:hypothetical protein